MEQDSKISLIDDDEVCHLISTKIINLFSSYSVESFTDAKEALTQFRWRASNEVVNLPEVILLDIDMPGMNGWQFLDEFEKLPDVVLNKSCVIMLSSSTSYLDMQKAKTYKSVKDFLSKPLTEEKVNLLRQYCEKKIISTEQ